MSDSRIFLGMPGYGKQTASAGRGFWRACADMSRVTNEYRQGSLLASNFNQLWCSAMNIVHEGGQVDYFAMLHDDIGPGDFWLDSLIDELEANQLDVLGVAVPIKDTRGMTSLALHNGHINCTHEDYSFFEKCKSKLFEWFKWHYPACDNNWMPRCRLTMHDVFELPETFTSEDLGHPLLLNTGCWVCKFDMKWATQVHFTINDRIVFNKAANRYQSQTEPEDWYFSRLCHELQLKVGATRKIPLTHRGEMDFQNVQPWGSQAFDRESIACSPVPGAFPRDIAGWLLPEEGAKLAELARGKRVLEIGSYCGRSTVCMARTAEHVAAVDYFDGRATPTPQDTLATFQANLKRYGVADKVEIYHPDANPKYPPYDLIFIDGAHDFESVTADIEKYTPYLSEGGLVAFHDYNEPCHPGINRAVDNWLSDGGEIVEICKHLAVVKPAAIPLEV